MADAAPQNDANGDDELDEIDNDVLDVLCRQYETQATQDQQPLMQQPVAPMQQPLMQQQPIPPQLMAPPAAAQQPAVQPPPMEQPLMQQPVAPMQQPLMQQPVALMQQPVLQQPLMQQPVALMQQPVLKLKTEMVPPAPPTAASRLEMDAAYEKAMKMACTSHFQECKATISQAFTPKIGQTINLYLKKIVEAPVFTGPFFGIMAKVCCPHALSTSNHSHLPLACVYA
jgi:hypothetical protein